MRVLVTGANGYVGRAARAALIDAGHDVVAAVRSLDRLSEPARAGGVAVGGIGPETDWTSALEGVDAVVHLVSPPLSHGTERQRAEEAERVIVAGTQRLMDQAIVAGVRRFIFMSSLKVLGEASGPRPFTESDPFDPQDAYAGAKARAEDAVRGCPGMETVILRPPAIYGRASGGNVRQMIELLRKAPPVLPLGYGGNRRSFVHRDNLVSAVLACVTHEAAAGRTFLVADGEAVSTGTLVRRVLRALGRRVLVIPTPRLVLAGAARLVFGAGGARRLVESYAIDDAAIRTALGWAPPLDGEAAMADAVVLGPDPYS
ncbi:MAG: NAD-dependent epimerase/dehydratase family protein [Alphaproteobacteria bacterium]|nr:NAD-dependent epimerase/dehydratase family protein [Alphaproteobacteria bacterium]